MNLTPTHTRTWPQSARASERRPLRPRGSTDTTSTNPSKTFSRDTNEKNRFSRTAAFSADEKQFQNDALVFEIIEGKAFLFFYSAFNQTFGFMFKVCLDGKFEIK